MKSIELNSFFAAVSLIMFCSFGFVALKSFLIVYASPFLLRIVFH